MTRTRRQKPITTYNVRDKPHKYINRLRDTNNIVCNENGVVIYIFANTGMSIPTIWKGRKKLLNS